METPQKGTPEYLEYLKKKYLRLSHAMQTGVEFKMGVDRGETTPKHLRVGVNVALVSLGALTALLAKKGLITEEEVYEHLVEFMQMDVDSYAANLKAAMGVDITLL